MKNKKLLSIIFLVITLFTLFVPLFSFNTFAVEPTSVDDEYQFNYGDIIIFESPLPNPFYGGLSPELMPTVTIDFQFIVLATNELYSAIRWDYISTNQVQLYYIKSSDNSAVLVYGDFLGINDNWIDDYYRYIEVMADLTNPLLYNWVISNSRFIESAYDVGFGDGYDVGHIDGYNAGVSSGIGENLLGSSLLAPVNALNSLVIYTAPSGFSITVWGVFSTLIGVGLFIWFIKLFAGG